MENNERYNEDKDHKVIKEILALEKINNMSKHYNNQEMVQKIIEILKRGVNNEI